MNDDVTDLIVDHLLAPIIPLEQAEELDHIGVLKNRKNGEQ